VKKLLLLVLSLLLVGCRSGSKVGNVWSAPKPNMRATVEECDTLSLQGDRVVKVVVGPDVVSSWGAHTIVNGHIPIQGVDGFRHILNCKISNPQCLPVAVGETEVATDGDWLYFTGGARYGGIRTCAPDSGYDGKPEHLVACTGHPVHKAADGTWANIP
jgi:hypothetical protein